MSHFEIFPGASKKRAPPGAPFLVSFLIFCFSYDNNNFSRFFSARSSDWERRFLTNCLTMSGIRFAQSRISSSCLAVTTVFERMDTKSVKAGTSDASARELPATYARCTAPGSGGFSSVELLFSCLRGVKFTG